MKRFFSILDIVIRYSSCLMLIIPFTGLALASVMGTDTGTIRAIAFSISVFVIGTGTLIGIVFLATNPVEAEKLIPGPPFVGKILVRLPSYIIGLGMMFIYLYGFLTHL